jgi:hypothetical protein
MDIAATAMAKASFETAGRGAYDPGDVADRAACPTTTERAGAPDNRDGTA